MHIDAEDGKSTLMLSYHHLKKSNYPEITLNSVLRKDFVRSQAHSVDDEAYDREWLTHKLGKVALLSLMVRLIDFYDNKTFTGVEIFQSFFFFLQTEHMKS